ncbi:MAG TPA: hypothetical protein VF060_34310 [Trebonia sp.]
MAAAILAAGVWFGLLPLLRVSAAWLSRRRLKTLSTFKATKASQLSGLEKLFSISAEQATGYAACDTEPLDLAA